MKIVQLNATCGRGSTGKICVAVSELLNKKDVENYILYSSGESTYPNGVRYATDTEVKLAALSSRVLGNYGLEAKRTTRKLISRLEQIRPDIIHIHNIHSHACDLELLFAFIRENHIKTFWTFHDCWAFTAYCPYFDMVKCDEWKRGCRHCVQRGQFSWFFDRSEYLYDRKKAVTEGLDLTIVTPSEWLAGLVKESFLRDYPVRVIHNGIDLTVFKPTPSSFREKYAIGNRHIVLGVAFGWGRRKGLDVFIELARRLDAAAYQIVLVGTDNAVDRQLPDGIISIHRTQDQTELAEIYTAADVFANPTREENYPTVNMEAIACGTPVITFHTGGSPEILDETCGSVVPCDDIDALEREIIRVCETEPYPVAACLAHAKGFDKDEKFKEYIALYEVLNGNV